MKKYLTTTRELITHTRTHEKVLGYNWRVTVGCLSLCMTGWHVWLCVCLTGGMSVCLAVVLTLSVTDCLLDWPRSFHRGLTIYSFFFTKPFDRPNPCIVSVDQTLLFCLHKTHLHIMLAEVLIPNRGARAITNLCRQGHASLTSLSNQKNHR